MQPEILAPAGSMESLVAALRCGADAVYVGGTMYSARGNAVNFDLAALQEASSLCRLYGAKLHLAVNTLLTDSELPEFMRYMEQAAPLVDACIVQDFGVLRMLHEGFPDMPLHASTQMSIHTPEGVMQAAALGCNRVVAARELCAEQLAALCRLPVEIEVFVHGALCMSVSGQCSFSALVGGRSANRGQCAQACRLPWHTPDGNAPAALSLRDNCLVQHTDALRRMGVTSFKIEGRMKRPEYVAAAVTALRTALDGKAPDLAVLQAVFSRSGFTDAYFTGTKQDMFGFRRKEDVLAGQTVLGELAALYRKPRTVTGLTFSMQLHEGQPSALTASDREGHAVTVQGDIPERAQKLPFDTQRLARSLQKLGDTVYVCDGVELNDPDGLMLTAAQCNALRREAAAQMDALRIQLHTPVCRIAPVSEPVAMPVKPTVRDRIHIRTQEQLTAAGDSIVCLPVHMAMQCEPKLSEWVEAPRIIADEEAYRNRLTILREKGYGHLLCHNLADIRIGKALGYALHGGFGLNVTNRQTVQSLKEMGLQDVTASIELRMRSICQMGDVLPVGAIVYGRLPMMLFRVCPIQAQEGCRKEHCYLTDRTGRRFPLLCSGAYQELVNAELLWIAGKNMDGLAYRDHYLTEETSDEITALLYAYRTGSGAAPEHRTSGAYYKGGLQ